VLCPAQIVVFPPIATTGNGVTVTVTLVLAVHPPGPLAVTV
jgi:hypothetical protein